MNVFEFAKKMEMDGKAMYERQLGKTKDAGLKSMLKRLIDSEQNHYEIFDAMEKRAKPIPVHKDSFQDVKNVFQEMKEAGDLEFEKDHMQFYEKALKVEEKSERFYRDHAPRMKEEKQRSMVLEIADEELKHVVLMFNILRFINQGAETIEDAEWNRPHEEF